MTAYIVTHGDTHDGVNPRMTLRAAKHILRLIPLIIKPPLVVIGMNTRCMETYKALAPKLIGISVKHSPFLGTADSQEQDGSIAIAIGNIPKVRYIDREHPCFHAWEFVADLPKNTLLISDTEMMNALGLKSEKCQLYKLNTDTKTGTSIVSIPVFLSFTDSSYDGSE